MSAALPFDLTYLTGAAVRPVLLPVDSPGTDPWEDITDIIDSIAPYDVVDSDAFNVGATAGPCQVSRNLTTSGFTIEQSQQTVLDEPQEIMYTVQIPFAELSPEVLALSYQGKIETVAPTAHVSTGGKKTTFGSVEDLDHFRVALIAKRRKAQGIVQEPPVGGNVLKRGCYLIYVGYDCTIMAENVQTSLGRGQLAQVPVTLKLYPLPNKPEGEEHGYWYEEAPGVLTAA